MKSYIKTLSFVFLGYNHIAAALNPVDGLYAGISLGASYSPQQTFSTHLNPTTLDITATPQTGTITFSGVGNIGIELGYRMNQFRMEGELLYNSSPVNSVKVGSYSVLRRQKKTGAGLKGATNTGAFMVNGLYDTFCLFDQSDFVPYIGAGIGYAEVGNTLKFYYNNTELGSVTAKKGVAAGQLILGINYFMDDFTTIGLDVRGFETEKLKETRKLSRNAARAFNDATSADRTVFSDSYNVKSFSFNLIFNGTFDLGA